jgi:hypothetical protein
LFLVGKKAVEDAETEAHPRQEIAGRAAVDLGSIIADQCGEIFQQSSVNPGPRVERCCETLSIRLAGEHAQRTDASPAKELPPPHRVKSDRPRLIQPDILSLDLEQLANQRLIEGCRPLNPSLPSADRIPVDVRLGPAFANG